jgi:glutaredoxin 2
VNSVLIATDVSRSFKKLQAEKLAVDKVLRELTPIEGINNAEALRDHLQNTSLKAEVGFIFLSSCFV